MHDRVTTWQVGDADFPAQRLARLGQAAPAQLTLRGNPAIWQARQGPLVALFCTTRAPGPVILAAHDMAQQARPGPVTFLSGFHTPTEEECFIVLRRGPHPVIYAPARAIHPFRLPPALRDPLEAGRLLLLSPFPSTVRRVTAATAWQRNRALAALADATLLLHAPPGSRTEQLARELLTWGTPLYTLPLPENDTLLALGARAWDGEVKVED